MRHWISLLLCGTITLGCSGGSNDDDDTSTGPGNGTDAGIIEERDGGREIVVALPGGATMEMAWVEEMSFMMGSPSFDPDRFDDEVQHEVTISQGFYLGKVELTQAQWTSVMGTQPWSGQDYVQVNPQHPAVYISWENVQELIQRLNEAEDRPVYRLPTEAEWEYACRAGTTSRWSFGEDKSRLGDYAWYNDNARNKGKQYAHAVGMKLPNPWGLHDMHGNVAEWVQDWYAPYASDAQVDPQGPASGSSRVIRGGDFDSCTRSARSANRGRDEPSYCLSYLGARLLRTQ